jgi:hypothetical protein
MSWKDLQTDVLMFTGIALFAKTVREFFLREWLGFTNWHVDIYWNGTVYIIFFVNRRVNSYTNCTVLQTDVLMFNIMAQFYRLTLIFAVLLFRKRFHDLML